MDNYVSERIAIALESLATQFERMNNLEQSRQEKEFPVPNYEGVEDASIFRVGDEQEEPKTQEEYQSLKTGEGRFTRLYKAATSGQ